MERRKRIDNGHHTAHHVYRADTLCWRKHTPVAEIESHRGKEAQQPAILPGGAVDSWVGDVYLPVERQPWQEVCISSPLEGRRELDGTGRYTAS